jgi:hypothetical protein
LKRRKKQLKDRETTEEMGGGAERMQGGVERMQGAS